MSGGFPGFGGNSGGGGGGSLPVDGRGLVFNVGGAKEDPVLVGMPIHGRGGITIENNSGIEGNLTIWGKPDGLLFAIEGVDCSTTADIEIGIPTEERQDTVVIDSFIFWGALLPPNLLRFTIATDINRTKTVLVPSTVSLVGLDAPDKFIKYDIPLVDQRISRYRSLFFKPLVAEANQKINIAVYRKVIRHIQVFGPGT